MASLVMTTEGILGVRSALSQIEAIRARNSGGRVKQTGSCNRIGLSLAGPAMRCLLLLDRGQEGRRIAYPERAFVVLQAHFQTFSQHMKP